MSIINYSAENGITTVFLSGHIDSANAPQVDKEIFDTLTASGNDTVIVDCEKLDYISSAGLRVLLRVRKNYPKTTVINVKSDVYDIFEITGFTEMMDIRKAFRVISVEGCEVIGQGANGKVYRIDRDTIVKVYINPDSLDDINRERELARTAFVLGVPTAIPYDVVRIEGGAYGSVFEMLNAKSLAQILRTGEMSVQEVTKLSVDLLKLIHGTVVRPDQMPDMKAVACGWAKYLEKYLPADKYAKLLKLFEDVPDDNHMMHGDYHLKNVMLQNGECLLIDMDTLCHGHPIFEFGSVFNAYVGFGIPDKTNVEQFLGLSFETTNEIWNTTLKLYFTGKSEKEIEAISKKAQVVGFTRILRRSIRLGKEQSIIDSTKNMLLSLLDEVDTLTF